MGSMNRYKAEDTGKDKINLQSSEDEVYITLLPHILLRPCMFSFPLSF